MLKTLTSALAVTLLASGAAETGERHDRTLVQWADVELPDGAESRRDGDRSVVTVTGQVGRLTVVAEPNITTPYYAVLADMKYDGVDEEAYVEMWNVFGENERYFTRTLAESGPTAKLVGTSPWRPLMLPFQIGDGETKRPNSLEFRVDLPGEGSVSLTDLRVVECKSLDELQDVYMTVAAE